MRHWEAVVKILHPFPSCGGEVGGFSTPPILKTPLGCPTIHLNFDTVYLEIASDSMA